MLGRENSILQRPSPLRHILPVGVFNPLPSSFYWARRTHFHAGSSLEPLIGSNLATVRSSQGKNLEALFASRRGGERRILQGGPVLSYHDPILSLGQATHLIEAAAVSNRRNHPGIGRACSLPSLGLLSKRHTFMKSSRGQ